MSRRKPGRPKEKGARVRANLYVRPKTLRKIDSLVDPSDVSRASRGKIVDKRFEE